MNGTHKMQNISWCPGCGNFTIRKTIEKLLDEGFLDREKTVIVSGIGQAAKLPHYIDVSMFNGLHGRAMPAATGVKLANHELNVIVTSGDGDMYGEGGNHLLHAMRRNLDIAMFVHNNQVYGLTKGQASPTSELGFKTKIQTHGVMAKPFNPLAIAISEDCPFVARTATADVEHMEEMMKLAIEAKGISLLDILQPCVSFNKVNTFKWYKERIKRLPEDYDPTDRVKAFETSLKWGDEIPIGVIYRNSNQQSFSEMHPVLQKGTLISQFDRIRQL